METIAPPFFVFHRFVYGNPLLSLLPQQQQQQQKETIFFFGCCFLNNKIPETTSTSLMLLRDSKMKMSQIMNARHNWKNEMAHSLIFCYSLFISFRPISWKQITNNNGDDSNPTNNRLAS
jgi:hypothetical protein